MMITCNIVKAVLKSSVKLPEGGCELGVRGLCHFKKIITTLPDFNLTNLTFRVVLLLFQETTSCNSCLATGACLFYYLTFIWWHTSLNIGFYCNILKNMQWKLDELHFMPAFHHAVHEIESSLAKHIKCSITIHPSHQIFHPVPFLKLLKIIMIINN